MIIVIIHATTRYPMNKMIMMVRSMTIWANHRLVQMYIARSCSHCPIFCSGLKNPNNVIKTSHDQWKSHAPERRWATPYTPRKVKIHQGVVQISGWADSPRLSHANSGCNATPSILAKISPSPIFATSAACGTDINIKYPGHIKSSARLPMILKINHTT